MSKFNLSFNPISSTIRTVSITTLPKTNMIRKEIAAAFAKKTESTNAYNRTIAAFAKCKAAIC
jgi:hypothetical protein